MRVVRAFMRVKLLVASVRVIPSITVPTEIDLTPSEQGSRYLYIDVAVKARANDVVGKVDYGRYVPRLWSGYWYLVKNESVIDSGSIQYRTQRIYSREFHDIVYAHNESWRTRYSFWQTQSDVTFPENNPIYRAKETETVVSANIWGSMESDGLLLSHLLDRVIIDVPSGVSVDVTVGYEAYADRWVYDPNSDTLTLDSPVVLPPVEPPNDSLDNVPTVQTFDSLARSRDYIPASECGAPPSYSYTVSHGGQSWTTGYCPSTSGSGSYSESGGSYTHTAPSLPVSWSLERGVSVSGMSFIHVFFPWDTVTPVLGDVIEVTLSNGSIERFLMAVPQDSAGFCRNITISSPFVSGI